jgi:hypothetical protein
VFFFAWVCHSFAFSTVFQAYLTSFLIDTGYEEPIKTIDQILKSGRKFGVPGRQKIFFNESNVSVGPSILKSMVPCPDIRICHDWASTRRIISTICYELSTDSSFPIQMSKDENNRPLLCDLEDGDILRFEILMAVLKGNPLLEHINDAIDRVVESGIFMHWKNKRFEIAGIVTKETLSYTLANTYLKMSIIHMQSAFYLLILGYTLAFLSFFIEIVWHRLFSKRNPSLVMPHIQ